ncbi:MAG: outer membrane beta-barrel protein [Candidatus Latescibacteria bacterium]|nr:outer membrane beta-barrel protein [Candidatus Latescibacterota bacterium]
MLKHIIAGVAALALTASTATAQIQVTDQFSVTGFIDMSAVSNDGELGMALDQFEIDLMFDMGEGLGVQADVQTAGGATDVEQAFMTYDFGDGLSLVAGKYLSVSGWETAEPTGLYQYSTSATLVYGGYQHGVGLSYKTDMFGLFGSVVTSVWDGTDTSLEEPGFEAQLTLTPADGFVAKVAYLYEDMPEAVGDFSTGLLNGWAMYETGPLTLAAEVNLLTNWTADGNDGTGLLGMVNYGLTDQLGITGRYSSLDLDFAADTVSEFTISPSYAITDNWLIVTEAKFVSEAEDTAHFALESLITF